MTRNRLGTLVFSLFVLSIGSFGSLGLAGCSGEPVGRICFIGNDAGSEETTVIASPALECQSRTCLHVQAKSPDLCTAECSSDDDCEKVPESPCKSGFTCAIPVTVGPFCCKKVCVCKDYITVPDGGLVEPAVCDDSNPNNECCNLDGRRGNSAYPQCGS